MTRRWGAVLALSLACVAATANEPDMRRGWHFYDDPALELPEPPGKLAPPPAPAPVKPARPPEVATIEAMQQRLDELRKVAIVTPTDANVLRYLQYEQMVTEQASRFADVAKRVSWAVPSLDPSARGQPENHAALKIYQEQRQSQRTTQLASLAVDHVLLFFFRSDCPYCHAFAPVLRAFERRHGIKVVAVSMDGGTLPDFPTPRPAGAMAQRLGVEQVPAVFLANPVKGTIATVAYGVISSEELEKRITTVAASAGQGASSVKVVGSLQGE